MSCLRYSQYPSNICRECNYVRSFIPVSYNLVSSTFSLVNVARDFNFLIFSKTAFSFTDFLYCFSLFNLVFFPPLLRALVIFISWLVTIARTCCLLPEHYDAYVFYARNREEVLAAAPGRLVLFRGRLLWKWNQRLKELRLPRQQIHAIRFVSLPCQINHFFW